MKVDLPTAVSMLKPERQRLFVAVTMELGLCHYLGVSGTRRIRKKKLKRLFRQTGIELAIDAFKAQREKT